MKDMVNSFTNRLVKSVYSFFNYFINIVIHYLYPRISNLCFWIAIALILYLAYLTISSNFVKKFVNIYILKNENSTCKKDNQFHFFQLKNLACLIFLNALTTLLLIFKDTIKRRTTSSYFFEIPLIVVIIILMLLADPFTIKYKYRTKLLLNVKKNIFILLPISYLNFIIGLICSQIIVGFKEIIAFSMLGIIWITLIFHLSLISQEYKINENHHPELSEVTIHKTKNDLKEKSI